MTFEDCLAQYEANAKIMREQQMQMAREEAKRKAEIAMTGTMMSILGAMASNSMLAAVTVKDAKVASEFGADGNRYLMAMALVSQGPDAVLKFLDETKP